MRLPLRGLELRTRTFEDGGDSEREAVVAFLRREAERLYAGGDPLGLRVERLALSIERGEHKPLPNQEN